MHVSRTLVALLLGGAPSLVAAQGSSTPPRIPAEQQLTVDRIFRSGEFRTQMFAEPHWLKDGTSYIDLQPSSSGGADIVRVDAVTGVSTVLVPRASLVLPSGRPIEIEDMSLSEDERKILLFHNSQRVWRQNTKGEYTVVDVATKKLTPIAPGTHPKLFAKFSPDGQQVGYVRDNNLFVTNLITGTEQQLTSDGSANLINGTTDWAYEEEFDLRDAFRWSPDGKRIAFWHFDQSPVPLMTLVDVTDSLYPSLYQYKYPKAGAPNSLVTVGVIDLATNARRMIKVGGDASTYIPRMGWVTSDSLWIEVMPRKQNRSDLLMASAVTGGVRTIATDRDSAYVDVAEPMWIKKNQQFLWTSDRSGWRQVYLYNRNGTLVRQVTTDGFDVLELLGFDEAHNQIYVRAAAPSASQSQIFRISIDNRKSTRVTPLPGTYSITASPTWKYASITYSSINTPPSAAIYELPSMKQVRSIGNNDALQSKLAGLGFPKVTFFQIPVANGMVKLDAYRIVPPGFDSTKKYPVLMYAYGGPATPQVLDQWGGSRFLFHEMLAQHGYVIVVADNRGSAWRGAAFRKVTQYKLGMLESDDQIAVARWIGQQSWGDASRIGMWGWSFGGYLTAMSAFRGGNVFKAAISVAPVTDWHYYDSIYTERFMWLPSENAEGYRSTSPLNYVSGLSAHYLLVHGTGDDNVHPQNSFTLAQKLQVARVPFSMMFFPNKTHSISGPGGTLTIFDLLQRFVLENL